MWGKLAYSKCSYLSSEVCCDTCNLLLGGWNYCWLLLKKEKRRLPDPRKSELVEKRITKLSVKRWQFFSPFLLTFPAAARITLSCRLCRLLADSHQNTTYCTSHNILFLKESLGQWINYSPINWCFTSVISVLRTAGMTGSEICETFCSFCSFPFIKKKKFSHWFKNVVSQRRENKWLSLRSGDGHVTCQQFSFIK